MTKERKPTLRERKIAEYVGRVLAGEGDIAVMPQPRWRMWRIGPYSVRYTTTSYPVGDFAGKFAARVVHYNTVEFFKLFATRKAAKAKAERLYWSYKRQVDKAAKASRKKHDGGKPNNPN